MKRLLLALMLSTSLSACASEAQALSARSHEHSSTGVLVDYAGKPCGNQNFHVKAPVCLFPHYE